MKVQYGSLFSQVLAMVDRAEFARAVTETESEKSAKGYKSWDHFVSMLFCQLAQAKSLREISSGLRSCEGKLKHLGLQSAPPKSTLAYANAHRPWGLFERVFYGVLDAVRKRAPGKKFRFKSKLLSLDSTVMEVCEQAFDWARYRTGKGAVKMHLLLDHDGYLPVFAVITEGKVADLTVAQSLDLPTGAIVVLDRGYNDYQMFERWTKAGIGFVTRLKANANFWVKERRAIKQGGIVRADELIEFQPIQAGRTIWETYRRVEIWNEEKQELISFLTNRLDLAAETIAAIYKDRWQIELFFKALKQNLRIKTFVGTSANAVRIQIWTALIAILLIKALHFSSRLSWAISNLVALLRWNLFSYRNLWDWLNDPFGTHPDWVADAQLELNLDSSA